MTDALTDRSLTSPGSPDDLLWKDLGITRPPTQDELPSDDGIPMETGRHKMQMDLLIEPLETWLGEREAYVSGNMFVYFSPNQVLTEDFRGPDVFVALDVPKGERKSWVVWQEGKAPDVVIELLSYSTATFDKTRKKEIYRDRLRVTEYFWFHPWEPDDFAGFILETGTYQPIPFNEQGHLVSRQLNLALVRWPGQYRNVEALWLRWATLDGTVLPTIQERAEQERLRAEQERLRADRAEQELEQLQQQLRSQRPSDEP